MFETEDMEKETDNSFDSIISCLENNHGVITEYIKDSEGNMKWLYCQDSFMKDVYNFFPERLCIDVTHKCGDFFLYFFLCEDSNGRNEIIALGFTYSSDNSDSYLWILNTFKKHNPNWRKMKIIILDPEIRFKEVTRNVFPSPYIVICFHHALKSFSKAIELIRIQNMVPNEQLKCAVELFKSMYNSISQAEYEMYYQQFLMLHTSFVFYFQEVWLPLQHLWRIGLDFFNENVFSSLNCHLEMLDNTFKVIFFSENSFELFVEKVFVILSIKRSEKSSLILYTNPSLYSGYSTEYQISKILTPFAARFVIDQIGLSSEIQMDFSILSDSYFFENLGSPVNATVSMCQCHFFLYFFLPCRHIFAVRKTLNFCAFDENLVDYTWTMTYYQSSLISIQSTLKRMNKALLKDYASKQLLTQHLLENSLLSLIEDSKLSESRMNILKELIQNWQNQKEVSIQFEGVEPEILLPEIETDSYIIDQLSASSLACKTEPSFIPCQLNKSKFLSKRLPISSKSFKIEYANSVFNDTVNHAVSEEDFKPSKWNFKSKMLDGAHINYAYLCRIICDSKETIIDWLRQMELICTNMLCPTCGCGMTLKLVPRLSDGAVWICSNDMEIKQSCSRRCSVRRGSWFELTNMSFEQILTFCYMWINGYSQSQVIAETGISTATFISWNKLNRRVCEEGLKGDANSCIAKMDYGSSQVLENWLEKCKGEDPFLNFLQDANAMHRKDAVKHSMG